MAVKSPGESPQDRSGTKQELDPADDPLASPGQIYEEGDETVYENEQGKVLAVEESHEENQLEREESEVREGRRLMHEDGADRTNDTPDEMDAQGVSGEKVSAGLRSAERQAKEEAGDSSQPPPERPGRGWRAGVRKMSTRGVLPRRETAQKAEEKPPPVAEKSHGPARAYQFGNTIIVEDEDGEVIKKYDIPAPEGKQGARPGQNTTKQRLDRMGKMLGLGGKDGKAQESAPGPSSGASPSAAPVDGQRPALERNDDDKDVRFTMSTGGRRMSKADFIEHIRDMDPKRRVQAVEDSNAPEAVKREARREARDQATLTRRETNSGAIPVVNEQPEAEEAFASLRPVTSHESNNALKLVDSSGQDVPFHDISQELRRYQMASPSGETAAERRRRQALERPIADEDSEDDGTDRVPPARHDDDENVPAPHNISQALRTHQLQSPEGETAAERRRIALQRATADEDSEDDGTERIPPGPQNESPPRGRLPSDGGETAAERRRREGALGIRHQQDSDSEEDDQPRQISQRQNIRFADEPTPPPPTAQPRQSTLRWGKNVGR